MIEEQAFEEVVADACQRMLLDTDAGQKLAEFGAQSRDNRSFVRNLKKWITEFMDRMRKIFRNVKSDTLAAKEFNRFDQKTKQDLADMFVDMTMDAGEKLSTIKEAGMTEKITTDQGGVSYKLSYSDAIEQLHKGTLDRSDNTHLKLMDNTPELYIKKADAKNLKIIMAWDTAYLAMNTSGDIPGNYHGLGKEVMQRIPAAIEDPLYIIKQNNGRIAAITEIVVEGKRSVLVSIELNTYKATKQEGAAEEDDYNLIVTVMDARPNYLKNTVFLGEVVYNKNNEAPAHFILRLNSLNKALPNDDLAGTSSKKITQSKDAVKEKDAEGAMPHKLPGSRDAADRGMLVDLFEQMVTSSNEYKALENYRKRINEMLALEEQVDRLGAEIQRLSFAEGPKDMDYIKKLKLLRQQAINRLNNYDNILLRLEKSGVLKAMIEWYRKGAEGNRLAFLSF